VIREGENLVRGVAVSVERKRVRRINVRIGPDGRVHVSLPLRGSSYEEAEAFLLSKWGWVERTRAGFASRPRPGAEPVTDLEREGLVSLLSELHARWSARLGEAGVTWRLRRMKTLWGSCHIPRRRIVYNLELAHAPREQVEYVVVHEFTHLCAASHGPLFRRLMDARLPGWRGLRRRLNARSPAG
jgi:hypothetical protein